MSKNFGKIKKKKNFKNLLLRWVAGEGGPGGGKGNTARSIRAVRLGSARFGDRKARPPRVRGRKHDSFSVSLARGPVRSRSNLRPAAGSRRQRLLQIALINPIGIRRCIWRIYYRSGAGQGRPPARRRAVGSHNVLPRFAASRARRVPPARPSAPSAPRPRRRDPDRRLADRTSKRHRHLAAPFKTDPRVTTLTEQTGKPDYSKLLNFFFSTKL